MSANFPPYAYLTGFQSYSPFEIVRIVKIPLSPNVRRGDNVLIITDAAADPRVWQAIAQAVCDLGGEPAIALFPPRPADGFDPPSSVGAAMLKSQLNVLNTTTAMLHCAASAAAQEQGIPSLALAYGMTAEQLCHGGSLADWNEVEEYSKRITEAYRGKIARIVTELGTDLEFSIEGRGRTYQGSDTPYKITRLKGWKLFGEVFPRGEVNVAPVEGSANGVAVIDVSMHIIKNRWLDLPIKITIRNSRIVSIEGGRDAETLEDFLKTYGDENAYYCPAEASVGTNPAAKFIGNQKEDKNVLGSMHIGIGTNEDVGGNVRSQIHLDGVISKPTLMIDGRVIVEKGVIKC